MTEEMADAELVEQLRQAARHCFDTSIGPFRRELDQIKTQIRGVAERTSRPPGSTLGRGSGLDTNQLSLSRQLADEAGFQTWIKSNKVPSSGYATELRLPPSRKAAITGISPTEHIGVIYGPPAQVLRLRSLMPNIPVTSGSVEYTQETAFTPSAAVVAEGAVKPTMAATYALATSKVATIAQVVKASVQSLADTPQLSLWLDQRLAYACSLKEEAVLLNGDATATPPINGLMNVAPVFSYVPATGDQGMDVIGHAIGQLMGQGYQPDGIVLNSTDYTAMRLLKTTIGSYIFMGTANTGPDDESIMESTPLIWQVPMVISPSMPAGQFLVGAFQQSTILFSRDTLNVQLAFQNEDDFIRNLVCLRGELRSGAAVPVPAGLLKGTLPAGSLTQASSNKK
jgi:HK97 family phage major capsid protein